MDLRENKVVQRLVSCAKNSPWLLIAVGLHVIVAAVMSVIYLQHERQKAHEAAVQIAVGATRAIVEDVIEPPEEIDRHKIPENDQAAELVTMEDEATFVPTEEIPEEEVDYTDPIGDPTGADDGDNAYTGGTSIGVGSGGHWGTGKPSSLLSRRVGRSSTGPHGRRTKGVPVGTEEAVLEGLRWLVRHQNEDGSWSVDTLAQHCKEGSPCIPAEAQLDTSFDVGMTSLALLAFLGRGISVSSKLEIVDPVEGKPHRASEVLKKGLKWLLERQKPDGSFSESGCFELPENDTLPTMVLCEAYGLSSSVRSLKVPAQRALDFLVAAQKRGPEGAPWGWGSSSQADLDARRARGELADEAYQEECANVDLSITCWVVMALKSAQTCGFRVPDAALAGALAYGVDATGKGALSGDANPMVDPQDKFTYHGARKAALGMLIRTFAGGEVTDPFLESAAREIAADVPEVGKDRLSVDFYYWYFATLALNQYDGPDSPRTGAGKLWEPWNKGLVAALPPLQDRTKKDDVCARGGWLQEARGNRRGRALYNTAMNILTLEVYYRFDNVFGAAARAHAGVR